MYNITEIQDRLAAAIQDHPWYDEYQLAGCYAIKANDKIVYIGRSKNMARRFIEHIQEIKNDKPAYGKYNILHQAWKLGFLIEFEVLHISTSDDIEEDIGREEAELINFFMPPLNSVIPDVEDWRHKYKKVNTAYNITLPQLLGIEPKGFGIRSINA